jgi:Bifunctional DNA primase/polymerase, N-terminal/CHC2 zinc finger
MSALLDAAIDYAARGWRVFPLRAGSKEPPRQFSWPQRATTDAGQLRAWWSLRPDLNLAIVTGDGLAVLDIDPRNGGLESFARLCRYRGWQPETPRVHTGRGDGGLHLYFSAPAGTRSGKVTQRGGGLDLKAEGGYVVAPPSIHPTGHRQYAWDPAATLDALEPLPDWIGEHMHGKVQTAAERAAQRTEKRRDDEYLETIAPPVYVADLAGLKVGPGGGKVRCPFHDDGDPSLHVYPTAERGWYCYGCGRGGSIYTFAAFVGGFLKLPGQRLRRGDFLQVEAILIDHYTAKLEAIA